MAAWTAACLASRACRAATLLAREPGAIQLRYLQTLADITTDKSSTIVFPLPIDLIKMFVERK